MGGEFAQRHEWRHDYSLDWHESEHPLHKGIQNLLKDLNELYKTEAALFEYNFSWEGFEWIDINDSLNSVFSWIRRGHSREEDLVLVGNFTPVCRENYRIGVPAMGQYEEMFNSDAFRYGGSNCGNEEILETAPVPKHRRTHSLSLTLPPLGLLMLKRLS
jgi:1,4-alpha-glucan branching enzyme